MTSAVSQSGPDELTRLEADFKQLKASYEKYFAGIERVEPLKDREELRKTLARLHTESNKSNNTARRFRLQTFQASLITHEQYWNRIARQIEEGTFKRDRIRAERLLREHEETSAQKAQPTEAAQGQAHAPEAKNAPQKSEAPAAPPGAPKAAVQRPSTKLPEPLQKLYTALNLARQQLGQSEPVPVDVFAATLQKTYQSVKTKYGCANVEFKVAVENGRAVLKALPK